MVRLKSLANPDRKWPTVVIVTIWVIIAYMIPNNVALFTPTPVPLIALDSWIAFQPNWVWAYISYYLILLVPYLVAREREVMDQMIYSYVVTAGASSLFFLFFPTTLPRELYPTVASNGFLSSLALDVVRILDNPVNCFPSMHVAFTTLAALSWLRSAKHHWWIAIPWALAIFVSTVATKQHYALDVFGGFCFGLGFFWFFANCVYVDDGAESLAAAVGRKNQP